MFHFPSIHSETIDPSVLQASTDICLQYLRQYALREAVKDMNQIIDPGKGQNYYLIFYVQRTFDRFYSQRSWVLSIYRYRPKHYMVYAVVSSDSEDLIWVVIWYEVYKRFDLSYDFSTVFYGHRILFVFKQNIVVTTLRARNPEPLLSVM